MKKGVILGGGGGGGGGGGSNFTTPPPPPSRPIPQEQIQCQNTKVEIGLNKQSKTKSARIEAIRGQRKTQKKQD